MSQPDTDVRRRVRRIIPVGETLPPELGRDVIDLGADAVPALLEILENEQLALETSPGEGWAPIHAALLLGELRAVSAVEPMLRTLAGTELDEILRGRIAQSLPLLGAAAIEPTLRAHAATDDRDLRSDLAGILARAGVRDERVLAVLLEELRANPLCGAGDLAEYGDPSVLPALHRAFDAHVLENGDGPFANQDLIELSGAIADLGGELSPAQHEKLRLGKEPGERYRQALLASRRERPGRNEPCWCGSGTKYKKCHLADDESGGSAA